MSKLQYLGYCIKEGLRLYPSVPTIARSMLEDTNVNGHIIPKGVRFVCCCFPRANGLYSGWRLCTSICYSQTRGKLGEPRGIHPRTSYRRELKGKTRFCFCSIQCGTKKVSDSFSYIRISQFLVVSDKTLLPMRRNAFSLWFYERSKWDQWKGILLKWSRPLSAERSRESKCTSSYASDWWILVFLRTL